MRLVIRLFFIFLCSGGVQEVVAQSCISTGLNGTSVNLPCNVNCAPMTFRVPHLKSTSDYSVVSIPFTPFPFTTPGGIEPLPSYIDDKYSPVVTMPFFFCFYDSIYNKVVIGSNGIITFDEAQSTLNNAYTLYTSGGPQTIPYNGGSPNSISTTYYPKASIMGAYHDIDPGASSVPPGRKIEYSIVGTSPCRKFIVSYYDIPMFGSSCGNLICTQQIVLNESTGIVDVFLLNKPICTNWTTTHPGLAILGMQNWARDKAVAAPGKNATQWAAVNEGYRFIPSGPVSRFVKAELVNFSGAILATTGITPGADTATTVAGLLDLNFPQQCPTGNSTPYIVKTYFASCVDNSQMVSSDTITIVKTTSLNATATATPSACGPNGSILVNIPAGAGTTPYLLSIDGALPVSESGQSHTFSGLLGGAHSILISTAGGCSQMLNITVPSSGTLTVVPNVTPTSCAGAANGSFIINPQNGVAPHQYSLNNGVTWQTNNSFTNLPPGAYLVSVKDNSGCFLSNLQVNVPVGPPMTATVAVVPPVCAGGANGMITVNPPATATAPILYQIGTSGFQPNNVFTGLPTGTYFVSVRDALGCTVNNMLINVPGGSGTLAASATTNSTSCAGANNGSINISSANGNAPLQYSLNNGTTWVTGATIPNLAPGSYTFLVKDNGGCTSAPITATVAIGGALVATATSTPASCNGVNNGKITVTASTGSLHTYQLDGGTPQSSNVFDNVSAGSHTVIVRDGAGCVSNPIPVTVAVGPAITGSAITAATSCNGAANGTITVTPAISGTFQFSLDAGAFQAGNIFTNVSSGSHSIVIKDAAGCTSAPLPVTVIAGPALSGSAASSPTSCTGVSNGGISVVPQNGTSPFQYALDGAPIFQSSNAFTGVSAGSHSVIIKDAAGCLSAPIPVTVSVGPPLTANTTTTATSCNGATDGVVQITPTNGAGPFTYQIDGGAFQASPTFNNISAGNHTVVIRETSGCTSSPINVSVAAGTVLTAGITTTPTSCNGANNGTITVTPANTSSYQYSLDGINFQSSSTFNGLGNGSYTVTFKNNIGCQSTAQATITAGQPLSASTSITNVSCNGGNDGSVSISISANGVAPFRYSLDGGSTWQNASIFSGLTSGSYTVTFRDNNNCTGTKDFSITQPAPLTVNPSEQAALCNGQSNGVILIAASGGAAPYRYSINGITYQSANNFNVAAGSYTVYVKDNNNCVKSQHVNITEPQMLSASSVNTSSTCSGNDGTITLSPLGGSGNYTYSINGTNYQSGNVFNVGPGNYTVTVKDANGCITTVNETVSLTNTLFINPVDDTITCEGVGVLLQPNTNATQFSWLPASGLSASNVRQPIARPSITTDYEVTAILGICSARDTIRVNVNPAPVADAGGDGDLCYGQTFQLQGSGGVSFEWSPGTYVTSGSGTYGPVVTPAQTIQYSLHVFDDKNCKSLQPDVVTVHVTPPIVVQISRDTSAALGDQFQLFASSVATDYVWSPATGLSDPFIANPVVTISGDVTYTVIATTSAQCKGSASVTIKVYEGPEIYVPTAFTPNHDGRNDLFTPFPVGIKEYVYFRVFNRWGQVIFSTTTFGKGWDGTINGKMLATGTYIWMIEGITKDDRKITKRGTITLIR